MTSRRSFIRRALGAVVAVVVGAYCPGTTADDSSRHGWHGICEWHGETDSDYSNSDNWVRGTMPVDGITHTVVFRGQPGSTVTLEHGFGVVESYNGAIGSADDSDPPRLKLFTPLR